MLLVGAPCERPQGGGGPVGAVGAGRHTGAVGAGQNAGEPVAAAFGAGMVTCIPVPGILSPTCNRHFRGRR